MNYNELPQVAPTHARIAELLARIESTLARIATLEAENNSLKVTLQVADEHLKSYRQQKEDLKKSIEVLAIEHIEDKEAFFDALVELLDIELTKVVSRQFTTTLTVQATVPVGMSEDEVTEELQNARLDYEHLGNGDIEIDSFKFEDLEEE